MVYYARNRPSFNYAPVPRVCFGLTADGYCTSAPIAQGFCASHQEQAMWANPKVAGISAAKRRAHAEGRRCCGLTLKFALCCNNPGGNFAFCWRHGRQRPLDVGLAPRAEPPQTAIVRERMREFFRIQRESEARRYEARDNWAREEQRRREQEQERRRSEEQENARREQQQREESQWEQGSRSYQRYRRYQARNAEDTRQSEEEQRRREQEQEEREREEARRRREHQQEEREREQARQRREQEREQARQRREDDARRANQAQDLDFHAKILQRYVNNSAVFDQTLFSEKDPNTFSRVPWPVFPRPDGAVLSPGDITPENIRRFFDSSKIQQFKTVPTAREIDVILKNTLRRFHPDRFSARRPVVFTIRDPADRNAAIEAAEIVTKTVNAFR